MGWPENGDSFPPPGRTRLNLAEARELLVGAPEFLGSSTRSDLWNSLERYLARFIELERIYESHLEGRHLVEYLWLGGSYVSSKRDPRNIDLTVILNGQSRSVLRGKPGAKWLTEAFNRDKTLAEFSLSPIELRYEPLASPFRSHLLPPNGQAYLRERGAWDDWWQRCRKGGVEDESPTVDTARAARGYLEVTL